ncbi:ATP-grasp domain protein [Pseudodesulfovibrio hydrargyri]|uniref:ATP-grasp domain protein n=1 Tax=Pseudodesulfovibrio hydrargyri TaxID=2125990 RepID=A0A1J5NIP1_9BACT|nr:ATP-grasp domain-containing protein [Pseudodesulfovibrio hydrargyri]OIQ51545.1 ATP-grasp domain protein [Pseudodesulfovibrio hydrargyri]
MRILLAGVSVRALAQSAVRAGHDVACLDFFGDRDMPEGAPKVSMCGAGCESYEASALADLAQGIEYDALAYVASLENHPDLVARLAGDRPIIGNRPDTLRRVRDWTGLAAFCRRAGVAMPPTLAEAEVPTASKGTGDWLLKPVKSGGGHSIRPWEGGIPERGWYLQQRVHGLAASAVFEADGARCRVLGISEQLIGLGRFGAAGYRYCGNLYPLEPQAGNGRLGQWVGETAHKLTAHFGLRGVNGLDFVIPPVGDPILIEVNPRPPASAELMESAHGKSIFSAHLSPLSEPSPHRDTARVHGKAVVFAVRDVTAPDTDPWLGMERRDIPESGQVIAAGHPICTVLAGGDNRRECLDRLRQEADAVRRDTGDAPPGGE